MPRPSRLAVLLLACAACAHGELFPPRDDVAAAAPAPVATPVPPAPQRGDAARLEAVRAGVDQLLAAQAEVLWQAWTTGAAPDLQRATKGRDGLFSRDTLRFVQEAREAATGDERRARSLLYAFLVGEHLGQVTAGALPPTPTPVAWDGGAVPAWRVPGLLAAETSAPRRAALERAWAEAERRRSGDVAARWEAIGAAATGLGYGSLAALAAELRGASLDELAALSDEVLAATGPAYRGLLEALARAELGKPLAEVRGRDLPRLLRAGEDPHAFPGARAAADAQDALAGVGLDLAARPGLVIDGTARSGKDPRALALPVRVPDGVRVSYAPAGGVAEVRGLLHEFGAAAYYSHVDTPVMEFRRLGTVTAEAWAALFEDLAGDPAWLAEHTLLDEHHLAPLVRAALLRRLHRARALAARVLAEVARARDPANAPTVARAALERAMARPVEQDEADLFLLERDPLLESADALRAQLLAAQARAFLDARSGGPWWRSKESGAWLAAAFAEGSRRSPSDLARTMGAARLGASALEAVTQARAAKAGLRLAGGAPGTPGSPDEAAAPAPAR